MEQADGARHRSVGMVVQTQGTTNVAVLRPDKVNVLKGQQGGREENRVRPVPVYGAYRC